MIMTKGCIRVTVGVELNVYTSSTAYPVYRGRERGLEQEKNKITEKIHSIHHLIHPVTKTIIRKTSAASW